MLGALKGVMKNKGLGMNVKKVLYEKVVVPTVMYGSESWGMKVTENIYSIHTHTSIYMYVLVIYNYFFSFLFITGLPPLLVPLGS